jgi:hypothetical protein
VYTDEQLVAKAAGLRDEQDKWNDLFATKLIELLDKIDDIRSGIKTELSDAQKERLTSHEILTSRRILLSQQSEVPELLSKFESHVKSIEALKAEFQAEVLAATNNRTSSVEARTHFEIAAAERSTAVEELKSAQAALDQAQKREAHIVDELLVTKKNLDTASGELAKAEASLELATGSLEVARGSYQAASTIFSVTVRLSAVLAIAVTIAAIVLLVLGAVVVSQSRTALLSIGFFLFAGAGVWLVWLKRAQGAINEK